MSKFKVGDKVFFPPSGGKVFGLEDSGINVYPISVDVGFARVTFTSKGCENPTFVGSAIFHATKENHELLSKLYPEIQFELPPITNNEIVRQMLEDGKPVMCYLSDDSYDMAVFKGVYGLVAYYDTNEGFDAGGSYWQYVVPMTYSDVMSKIGFIQESVNA